MDETEGYTMHHQQTATVYAHPTAFGHMKSVQERTGLVPKLVCSGKKIELVQPAPAKPTSFNPWGGDAA